MSGFPGSLSEQQQQILDTFKEKIEKEFLEPNEATLTPVERFLFGEDSVYLRFLRARKWDVEQAYTMLIAAARWRKDFQNGLGVDKISEESIENELGSGKSFFYKYDKKDRPVLYIRPKFHFGGAVQPDEMERYVVWHMEQGRELLKPGIEQSLVIYDMEGFGLSNMDYGIVKTEIHLLQNYYPESMGLTLILNAPWFFRGCWAIVKAWIDPAARHKIVFVTKEQLLEYIEPENLLEEYGGKDPFRYEYIPQSQREEKGRPDFKPTWLMPWATEWKKDLIEVPVDEEETEIGEVKVDVLAEDNESSATNDDNAKEEGERSSSSESEEATTSA